MSDTAKVEIIENGFVTTGSSESHCGFLADHAYRRDSSLLTFYLQNIFYIIYGIILQISKSKLKPSYPNN